MAVMIETEMYHLLFYDVVDDYVTKRAPFREEHIALARRAHERGELVLCGALTNPADGAVLVFRGSSKKAIEEFVKADPYVANRLVTSWRIREWMTVIF